MNPRLTLTSALVLGPMREYPGRLALAVAAIALGVALGVAVHLINASAVNEFGIAARHLAGRADLVVRGPRAGFDEALYPQLARLPGVEGANPAVELEVALGDREGASLRMLAFDPLRAASVQPALLPEGTGLVGDLLNGDTVLLSPEAAQWLGLARGDWLTVTVGTDRVSLKVVGLLPHDAYRQRLAVTDIATAQWRFDRLGRLNRIDLKLTAGVDRAAFRRDLERRLPPGVQIATPDDEAHRAAVLSRAYRTNLDLLALIALFSGAFLVFSSQALALLRRRAQLAVLRAMGVTRTMLVRWLVAEGALIGAVGAACGIGLGYFMSRHAVRLIGADLGAGYFRAIASDIVADPQALAVFFALGIGYAAAGAAIPAWEAARRPPAQALRAGDEEPPKHDRRGFRWGVGLLAAALPCASLPAIAGLPIGGYAAIMLILIGSVLIMPALAALCVDRLPMPSRTPAAIALAQLKATPRQSAISIAAIVISMSLMASMLIMVHSFRTSLDAWLAHMLPADLYLRAGTAGETGYLTTAIQAQLAATPGVVRAEFLRSQTLQLDAARAPLTLLARAIDERHPEDTLPLMGTALGPKPGQPPPVWVSEAASDLYGLHVGTEIALPLGGERHRFTVAGVWRDYARQNGAIVIPRARYIALTGDRLASDAALWLAAGTAPSAALAAVRERLGNASGVEISSAREVRAASLAIFDRTFAITYALEAAAIVVGLFGVSVSFSAQALARRREFGVLRHLGMTRREIGIMLGIEGALITALGAGFGLVVGWIASLVLVHVVNRQSFHWSMEMHLPWAALAALACVVVMAAGLTAVLSGRPATRADAVRAVREDW